MEMQLGYFSKDVAEELGITTSTLRRWSIELEKQGYVFSRNENGQRVYYERDYKVLRELKKLLSKSVPFENALKVAITTVSEDENIAKSPSVNHEIVRLTQEELQSIIKKAVEEEREIVLEAIDTKLNNFIEQRDRQLVTQLKMAMEQKQLESQQVEPKKKGIWSRIFSR